MDKGVTLSLLTIFGGIVAGYITFKLNRSKELEFSWRKQKETRYKAAILHMAAYLEDDLEYLVSRPEITNIGQVLPHLRAEYHQMTLYASKAVVSSVNSFMQSPSQESFAIDLLAMRNDLWIRKRDLNMDEVRLDKRKAKTRS